MRAALAFICLVSGPPLLDAPVPVEAAAVAQDAHAAECGEWTACRQLALDAHARKDYEAFHDLAWRAVQLGPKNDPALLFLLARAQSLSGRPHDALVMLRRLGRSDVTREAVGSAEFARVRALREWPEVEALLASAAAADTEPAPPAPAPLPRKAPVGSRAPRPSDAAAPPGVAAAPSADPTPARPAAPPDAFTFAAASFKPAALAYDGVSRRFIIGDTDVSRLAVIDEFSRHVATLATGRSAGFAIVTAIAIDPRVGDLWVASVEGASGSDLPALYKLQLISGRVLKQFSSANPTAGRFADVGVARDGTVVAIQEGGEVLRLAPGGASLKRMTVVPDDTLTSVAIASDGSIYVSGARGLLRLRQDRATALKPPAGVDLGGLARIRWSRGSLIGLQRAADGGYQVIRARLGRNGQSVVSVDVLDPSVSTASPTAVTLTGNVFYYLAKTPGAELAIRKIVIR